MWSSDKLLKLNLTKSRGASSVYEPNIDFLNQFPESSRFDIEKKINIEATTIDNLSLSKEIDSIDFTKIDTQGAELLFLHGAKKSLNYCKSIFIEVSNAEIYDKGSKWSDVKDFLNSNGFNQVTELNSDHTDVLFIKKSF